MSGSIENMVEGVKSLLTEHIATMSVNDLICLNPKLRNAVSILIQGCQEKGAISSLYEWDKAREK